MATKKTTSFTTTTNFNTGQSTSFKTTSKTSTPTNIGKGGLSNVGRLGMIAITLIAVGVGSTLYDFSTTDLQETTPNYLNNNTYIPIEDPLINLNYIQYGQNVVNNTLNFIQPLSDFGQFVNKAWSDILRFWGDDQTIQEGSFIDTYGYERFNELFEIYNSIPVEQGKSLVVYLNLTSSEITYLNTVNINLFNRAEQLLFLSTTWYLVYFDLLDFFGGVQWFWTMPNVIELVQEY